MANEETLLFVGSGETVANGSLEKGHQFQIVVGDLFQECLKQGTVGGGIIVYVDQFGDVVALPVGTLFTGAQVQGSIIANQQEGIRIKFQRADVHLVPR